MTGALPRGSEQRHQLLSVLFLVSIAAYTLWLAQPQLAFVPGSPDNTDLGGHIVAIRHLIERSLPAGHLQDWSHEWFGGYPTFHFYFPLPALLIATLSLVLPLESAAKLVAAAAPTLLPVCTWVVARQGGLTRLHAGGATIGAVTSLCLTTQYIHGGNVLSSVIGEYSYALGFCLVLLYLGRLSKAARGSSEALALSVLLGLTALTHLIPTLFAVLASCGFLRDPRVRRQVLISWTVGFGLSAFWSIPFLVRSRLMGNLRWEYGVSLSDLLPLPLLIIVPFAPLAIAPLLRTRIAGVQALAFLGASSVLFYFVPHHFFAQSRALPFWYFSVYALTGLGLAEGLARDADRRFWRVFHLAGIALLIGVGLAQAPLVRARSAVLLSSERADSQAYAELVETLRELPPGRIHWEYIPTSDDVLGNTIGLARIPFHVRHMTSTFGLLLESGFMTPVYSHLNSVITRSDDAAGASLLRLMGVNYFVSFTADRHAWASRHPDYLHPIRSGEQWTVWTVAAAPLVEPLSQAADPWGTGQRPDAGWRDGVSAWLGEVEAAADTLIGRNGGALVSDIELTHRRIRFVTAAPGTPHRVHVAWFPNWRSDQAAGPFLVPPGFMVVVPQQNTVELRFERTWAEIAGLIVSALCLLGVLTAVTRRRVRSK